MTRKSNAQKFKEPPNRHLPKPTRTNLFEGPGGITNKTKFCKDYYVDLKAIEDTEVYDMLEHNQLLSYVSTQMPTNPSAVHYFYRHFDMFEGNNWRIEIPFEKDNVRRFTMTDFCDLFGYDMALVGNDGFCDAEISTWPQALVNNNIPDYDAATILLNNVNDNVHRMCKELTDTPDTKFLRGNDKILHHIVKNIILPIHTNDTKVSYIHAALMCLIKLRLPIHLPKLIFNHMWNAPLCKTSAWLPYGGLITRIMGFMSLEVDVNPFLESVPNPARLDRGNIARTGCAMVERNFIVHWEVAFMSKEDFTSLKRRRTKRKRADPTAAGTSTEIAEIGVAVEDSGDEGDDVPIAEDFVASGEDEEEEEPPRESRASEQELLNEIREVRAEQARAKAKAKDRHMRAKKRDSRLRGFLRVLASACSCKKEDTASFDISSPESDD